MQKKNKSVAFKNNAPFINCISEINRVVCGIVTEMKQAILFLLILSILNTRQVLQEILIMLVMVRIIMMQTKLVKMKLKLLFH